MNNFIILLLVVTCLSFTEHKQSEEKIIWGQREIQWDDFKGVPPKDHNSFTGAITSTIISTEYGGFPGSIPTTKVQCYFIKNKSWTLLKDSYSLAHERLHFDISEVFARKIRKAFDSLRVNEITELAEYEQIVEIYDKKQKAFNREYDTQVYSNKEKQELWSEKIKSELKALGEYKCLPSDE